ncbi:MAG: hypothetical protein JKY65_20875 [Planctomycetes bacterium]|nr:hypothetical protein [Planctomycetota bacterium]
MTKWTLAWLAAPLLAGVFGMGCGSESNPGPSSASTAAGATSGSQTVVAPVGPFTRGTASPQNIPDPATVGPAVCPVSPTRGAQTEQASVAVVISAVDPDGVARVTINGDPATSIGNDQWQATASLELGMNVVQFEAEDALGNMTGGYLSITRGQLVPTNQLYRNGVTLALTPSGLNTVGDVAENALVNLNLESLVLGANPLVKQTGLKLTATKLAHDPILVELEGAPTGLRARAHLDMVRLEAAAEFIGFGLTNVIITADRATGLANAQISQGLFTGTARANKQALGLELDALQITFQNFKVTTTSGFFTALLSPFRGTVENTVRDKLEVLLMDLVADELAKAMVGLDTPLTVGITNPLTQTLHELDFKVELHEALGSVQQGVVLTAGAMATAKNPVWNTPGTFVALGGAPARPMVPGPEAFGIRISSDAINALLHAGWRTGGIQGKIEGRAPKPGTTLQLSAQMLYPFIPVVRDLAPDPDTPLTIEVDLGASPMLLFGSKPGVPYQLSLGEAEARLMIDYMDGQPPLHLFTLRFAATAEVDVSVVANKIAIDNLRATVAGVDVIPGPTVQIRDQEIEDFLKAILPQVLGSLMPALPPIPLPALPFGLNMQNPRMLVDPGHLSIYSDL